MKTLLMTIGLAASLALAAAGAGPAPTARAIDEVNDCPVPISGFTDPWLQVGFEDPDERLADRNGDGLVCEATLTVLRRPVVRVLTDNAVGNPHIIPPGPCTDPFRAIAVGNPNIFPWLRQIDLNGDGLICGQPPPEPEAPTLVLVDNPSQIPRG